jgi:addiction module RelB/DinJ family antitoxin
MSLVTRTAIIQARVSPEIKYAGEKVLKKLGLNLTEVMEMFIRRMIADQALPFAVIALDDALLERLAQEYEHQLKAMTNAKSRNNNRRQKTRLKRE